MGWGMAVSRRSRRDFGITALGGAAAIFALVSVSAHAEPVEEFFSGRQIKFVVGSAGGGGYESYSRLPGRSRPAEAHHQSGERREDRRAPRPHLREPQGCARSGRGALAAKLKRDDFSSNRHPAL